MHLPEVFLGLLFLRKYRLTGAHLLPRNIYHVNLATSYCVLYRLLTCVLNTISTPVHIFAMRPNTRLPLVCLILAHISSLPDFPPTYLNLCISVHREHEFCAVAKMLILILYTFICLHPYREFVFSSSSFCTSSSLDVPAGVTQEEGHRISHPPSFCGACLNFSRERVCTENSERA